MNSINVNQTGGFPLTTDVLSYMQNAYKIFNAMSGISGDLIILSGCEVVGNTVSDGVVAIEGEIYPFQGTTLGSHVFIKEVNTSKIFEDGSQKTVLVEKVATFGSSTKSYPWESFRRVLNNRQIEEKSFTEETSLLKRLEKLEERVKKTVPLGLVAIWDRPASDIPEGWVEHTEMQGVVPVGYKSNDDSFNRIGTTVGTKEEKVELKNLPNIKLNLENQNGSGFEILGDNLKNITSWHRGGGQWAEGHHLPEWGKEQGDYLKAILKGGEEPINNIQPSRIVKFIRFVGF
ncbi:Uncharacterised protein [Capnocytophaga ochracea]|uniref:Uncharacterized protein n=1 Tax=Capnocytophaga ochracea TaxID=1018 RepID=A0A7Z8YC33_CAPOC|nr:hypothetical protein [Capnocytophaga ochracea]VDG81594.1 Uncharacterised protein [Capnocytophaga ochracea]